MAQIKQEFKINNINVVREEGEILQIKSRGNQ